MTKIRSCITETNFRNFLTPSLAAVEVSESTSIAANSWAWNDTYKAAHVNDGSAALKAVAEINIGFIKSGESIRLSAEFMNISGAKGVIYLDGADNQAYTAGYANALIYRSSKVGEFEETNVTFIARKDGYYKAGFGLLTADIGDYYMRNCNVKIDTIADIDSVNYKQVIKTGVIRTTAPGVFERDTRFGVDDFTITVNANYLVLTFAKPFTLTTARPFVGISEDSTGSQYKIRTTSQQVTTVTIQFFDTATNALVNHTTIIPGIYFGWSAIGYDII